MAEERKNADISPGFSKDIEYRQADSFFQKGFRFVNKILFIFLVSISLLFIVAIFFAAFFSIHLKVKGKGILEPAVYKEVRTEMDSVISKIHVTNGDKVEKGDLLVELSDTDYRNRLYQAEKDLEAAKAELQKKIEQFKLSHENIQNIISRTNIRSKVAGIIQNVYVDYGDKVEKGDLLVELSDTDYRNRLYQAEKDLEIAKAELERKIELYKLSYSLYRDVLNKLPNNRNLSEIPEIAIQQMIKAKLRKQVDFLKEKIEETRIVSPISGYVLTTKLQELIGKHVSEGEVIMAIGMLDNKKQILRRCKNATIAIPEITAQQSMVEKYAKQVDLLRNRIRKTKLYAPMSGTIITPNLQKKVGRWVRKGETLLVVANLDKWVVKTMIHEKDIPKLKKGNRAKIKIDAFPFMEFKTFTGTVKHISNIPSTITIPALLSSSDNDKKEQIPLYFEVTIEMDDKYATKNSTIYDFQFGLLADVDIVLSKKRIIVYLWELLLGKLEN